TQPTLVDIRQSADWRLSRETADYLLWWTPLGVDLLQVGECLHEEERSAVGQVEVVEPHRLVQAQRIPPQGQLPFGTEADSGADTAGTDRPAQPDPRRREYLARQDYDNSSIGFGSRR